MPSNTLDNIVGSRFQFVRCGDSRLALLTINSGSGAPGLFYLVQDTAFVSNAQRGDHVEVPDISHETGTRAAPMGASKVDIGAES